MPTQTSTNPLGPIRVFADKTPIYHQDDEACRIYRVNSGVVMTFRLLEDSQRQITGFCTEGEFFGLSPDGIHHDGAITVTSAGIQSVSVADIENNADLRQTLLTFSYRKVEDTQNLLITLTKKSSEARVAAFLIMLAERRVRRQESREPIRIALPMSRVDIADYLGLSRETVSRRLTDLQSDGVIELPDIHTACIAGLEKLRQRAGACA